MWANSSCGEREPSDKLEEEGKKQDMSARVSRRGAEIVRKSPCDSVFCHLPSGSLYTKRAVSKRDGERERKRQAGSSIWHPYAAARPLGDFRDRR